MKLSDMLNNDVIATKYEFISDTFGFYLIWSPLTA